jgi:hypothetical protein
MPFRPSSIPRPFVALAVLIALLALVSCSHIEPHRTLIDERLPGDKAWDFVHPWYDTDWNGWAKAAYWIGPGH